MKKLAILLIAILLTGCTPRTEYGECIGAFDNGDPSLKYKMSVWNTVLAIIFLETVFVPAIVIADVARCPVGHMPNAKGGA